MVTTVPRLDLASWQDPHTGVFRQVPANGFDLLPLGTFVIWSIIGTAGQPSKVARIVKPGHPERYSWGNRTDKGRLLYVFYSAGHARKSLVFGVHEPETRRVRYIIQPGDDGFEKLDAFKIFCDTRRAGSIKPPKVNPRLLHEVVGWPPTLPK